MDKKITIIGAGNMGTAITHGLIKAKFTKSDHITLTNPYFDHVPSLQKELGINTTSDNAAGCIDADVIICAVKPPVLPGVLNEIKTALSPNAIIISIATGFSLENAKSYLGNHIRFVRAMPNTPALVSEAMTGVAVNDALNKEEVDLVLSIFNTFGRAELVSEEELDCITGVSGSSPTLIYMLIEAMADAAVSQGLPRKKALEFAAQTVKGSAEMVLQTDLHPGLLKDNVCTPGGTSIEEVRTAEKLNLRSAVFESIVSGIQKARLLTKSE